jgi:sugar transferase (PEP-CTERM/EpsH1 system associated)
MKILWVKAGGLVPADTGGKIRSYHILRELARKHEVTFFTFYAAHPDDAHPQLETLFRHVVCHPLRLPAPKSFGEGLLYARHLFSSRPYSIAKYCQPQVAHELHELVQTEAYDVIVCDFIFAGGAIPWEIECPKVLFTHNVEAMIWKRHYQVARNPIWKAVCWREHYAIARAERLYLEKADHVVTVSEVDRDLFARFIDASKITAIPTGVDFEHFRPSLGQEKPNLLVFTGSMDWLPNEDGVFYFAEEILPRIRSDIPETTVWIVGRRPSLHLETLAAKGQGLRLTGWVEDIRPYVADAAVYIVPLRVGSGTRLKIFEAMAMGKAVVSTSIGAEGLPVQDGKNIILADKPEEFARAVVTLMKDPVARGELGRAARRLVERECSWASVAARFDAVLGMTAAKTPRGFVER